MWIPSLDAEDTLEEEIAIHSRSLAGKIPWAEKPGGLQSIGPQRALDQTEQFSPAHSSLNKPFLCSNSILSSDQKEEREFSGRAGGWDPMISLPGDPTFNLGSKIPQGGKAKGKKKGKKEGSFKRSFRRKFRKSTELLKLNNSICNMNRKY